VPVTTASESVESGKHCGATAEVSARARRETTAIKGKEGD
jgi:hypothetical protein